MITKHGCQTDRILHNTLLTRPARSMVTRQTQHYMTHCRQNPHKAWSPDRHNITRHTVDKTRTKHGRQTDTTYCQQDPHEAWSPDRHNITRHTVDKTRTKHGRQTDTTLHDILSTRPAQSMVARQTQHYMTHCRQDPHKAWTADRPNITQHTADKTCTNMVARQTQHYITHCKQDRHKAWT